MKPVVGCIFIRQYTSGNYYRVGYPLSIMFTQNVSSTLGVTFLTDRHIIFSDALWISCNV